MRTLVGVGTPRGLQGRLARLMAFVIALWTYVVDLWCDSGRHRPIPRLDSRRIIGSNGFPSVCQKEFFNHGLLEHAESDWLGICDDFRNNCSSKASGPETR